jgi:ferric-dicitrate binding protein FerR (iron transport regulator)
MALQACDFVSFVRRVVIRAGVGRGNGVMSVALQVLVLGVALIHPGAREPGYAYCGMGANNEPRELGSLLAEEQGITLAPRSRVSVRRTTKALLVHIVKGEVLFKRRESSDYPVVVTAGNTQIRNMEAVVCVGVEKERTVIAVRDGATEMWVLRPDGTRYAMNEITLRAGDLVELRESGADVVVRFATRVSGGWGSCGTAVPRKVRVARGWG